MNIWEHTIEELTGGASPVSSADLPLPEQAHDPGRIFCIESNPSYATAPLLDGSTLGDQVLLKWTGHHWSYAGSYVGDTLYVIPAARAKGVSEELFLRCMEHRDALPVSTNFSYAGYALLKRAHKLAVARAIEQGLSVPKRILADN